ncbi:MAG: hypothetical protein VKL59_04280 [Nostocaceae cyanobacterium]|nr:hypothetical protein [Nostocaceae cyanobacterium]
MYIKLPKNQRHSTAIKPLQAAPTDELEVIRTLAKLAIAQIERQSQEDDW